MSRSGALPWISKKLIEDIIKMDLLSIKVKNSDSTMKCRVTVSESVIGDDYWLFLLRSTRLIFGIHLKIFWCFQKYKIRYKHGVSKHTGLFN